MEIRTKVTDYQLTPDIEKYLDDRVRTLEKFLGEDVELARCEVELGRDAGRPRHGKNLWFAEFRIVLPGSDSIYARNNSESINGAIDDVKEEIERQLRKRKRLNRHFVRRGGAALKRWMRFGRD